MTTNNKLQDFPQGYYTLNQDTQNPKPDRRRNKDDVPYQTTWKKGTRFRIKKFPHLPTTLETANGIPFESNQQINAILPNLLPAPLATGQITDQHDAAPILALAIQQKLLSLSQLQSLQSLFQNLTDHDFESLMQNHWFWNKI